jgi:uncharacterized membrane protein
MVEPDEPELPADVEPAGHPAPSESIFVRSRFARAGTGLEFDRVANFADAIYAISLTLVVVGIVAPKLSDDSSAGELAEELGPLLPDIITFFIVFVVVGNYWIAHHRYMSWLGAVDRTLIGIQLVYLSVIAFLPFPVALLGSTGSNPLAFAMFAVSMAAASGLETAMIVHAHRAGLMRQRLSPEAFRWEWIMSLAAALIFLVSIPLAFVSVWLGYLFWFMNSPIGVLMNRRRPTEFGGPAHSRR